jgi:hypothetical protein
MTYSRSCSRCTLISIIPYFLEVLPAALLLPFQGELTSLLRFQSNVYKPTNIPVFLVDGNLKQIYTILLHCVDVMSSSACVNFVSCNRYIHIFISKREHTLKPLKHFISANYILACRPVARQQSRN